MCSKAAVEGDLFVSFNISHRAYPPHIPNSSPTKVALLSQLDNVMYSITSDTVNNKVVLEHIVACKTKLTTRNAALAATNKQLIGEVKVLREHSNHSNNTGVKDATKDVDTVPPMD